MKPKHVNRKWLSHIVFVAASLLCILLLAIEFNMGLLASIHSLNSSVSPQTSITTPRFAYLISGSNGDVERLWRTLLAVYHPLNQYIVHLDSKSPAEERLKLAKRVETHPLFASVGNVFMIRKANAVSYRGPTMIANTLHACAVLLKRSRDWDWFINLSPSDYPLVTQDDLLHTFSGLNRSLNFVEHTSKLGWKASRRARPIIIDSGLYSSAKQNILWLTQKRTVPTSFKLFTGSAWVVLSRPFVEYIIQGWDNLPRTLLMYHTNLVSSSEFYFQTVLCNAPEYINTALNHDMHYISWDHPPKQHPRSLTIRDYKKITSSNAAFARKFKQDDPVLDRIDRKLLNRSRHRVTPGGWCAGNPPCSQVGDPYDIKPGPGSARLGRLVYWLVSRYHQGHRCK